MFNIITDLAKNNQTQLNINLLPQVAHPTEAALPSP